MEDVIQSVNALLRNFIPGYAKITKSKHKNQSLLLVDRTHVGQLDFKFILGLELKRARIGLKHQQVALELHGRCQS